MRVINRTAIHLPPWRIPFHCPHHIQMNSTQWQMDPTRTSGMAMHPMDPIGLSLKVSRAKELRMDKCRTFSNISPGYFSYPCVFLSQGCIKKILQLVRA